MIKKLSIIAFSVLPLACVDTASAACVIFPANNVWNVKINTLPVHAFSEKWKANMGNGTQVHPDFGAGLWEGKQIGIKSNVSSSATKWGKFTFLYGAESDGGNYPVTGDVEDGSDRHLITINKDNCTLYETFNTDLSELKADSGAIFSLRSNAMRTNGFTSADAAGLPIYPGLVRFSEVKSGVIKHAIRFTVEKTRGNIFPATHMTSGKLGEVVDFQPPLGARFRLNASYDISTLAPQAKVVAQAMKDYGLILADNGGNWFVSGEPNAGWNDDDIGTLTKIRGSAFEAIDPSCMIVSPTSYQVDISKCGKIVPKERQAIPADFVKQLKDKMQAIQDLLKQWGY